mmetsp:Transcript_125408/g.287269  ORF Transcript_125408/g.287269 Transcript_125408/m.287269 type:complete len:348 (+) Transcript_125408:707-1750(+)
MNKNGSNGCPPNCIHCKLGEDPRVVHCVSTSVHAPPVSPAMHTSSKHHRPVTLIICPPCSSDRHTMDATRSHFAHTADLRNTQHPSHETVVVVVACSCCLVVGHSLHCFNQFRCSCLNLRSSCIQLLLNTKTGLPLQHRQLRCDHSLLLRELIGFLAEFRHFLFCLVQVSLGTPDGSTLKFFPLLLRHRRLILLPNLLCLCVRIFLRSPTLLHLLLHLAQLTLHLVDPVGFAGEAGSALRLTPSFRLLPVRSVRRRLHHTLLGIHNCKRRRLQHLHQAAPGIRPEQRVLQWVPHFVLPETRDFSSCHAAGLPDHRPEAGDQAAPGDLVTRGHVTGVLDDNGFSRDGL